MTPVIVGIGWFVMVSESAFVIPPPGAGFETLSLPVPTADRSVAVRLTASEEALVNMVGRALPFHCTTESGAKPEPARLIVAAWLISTVDGCMPVSTGAGEVTEKTVAVDWPPPGAGFTTASETDAAALNSVGGTTAFSSVALTNVVTSAVWFQNTVEPVAKLVPFTSSVRAALPSPIVVGDTDVTVGIGLFTAKLTAPDTPPPGAPLVAIRRSPPAVARSAAVRTTAICVTLMYVAVRAAEFTVTLVVGTKPAPVRVTVC